MPKDKSRCSVGHWFVCWIPAGPDQDSRPSVKSFTSRKEAEEFASSLLENCDVALAHYIEVFFGNRYAVEAKGVEFIVSG